MKILVKKMLIISTTFISAILFHHCSEKSDHSDSISVVQKLEDSFVVEKITFKSLDDLLVTADFYKVKGSSKMIILCHQANYSRGEYLEIAPKLCKLGYNCLAIDQRSGNSVNQVKNETYERATAQSKATDFLDAEQDIKAAINHAKLLNMNTVVLWGSSYSAGLVLKIAKENGSSITKVVAFSPGEYYFPDLILQNTITGLNVPSFLTAAKNEIADVKQLYDVMGGDKTLFTPTEAGVHGAKTLWENNANHQEYWSALTLFINK